MADTRYITHDKWMGLTATQVTYPNGRQVASGYDVLYRCNSVIETSGGASIAAWQFFGNRTATVALGNGITNSFMNNAQTNSAVQSSVALPAWGDKTTDRLGYDGSGRLIAKRFLPGGSTTALVGFTAAYDPSGNKLFERALHAESRGALYPSYDSMDRLVEYQRGVLASRGGSVTTPITLPGTDNQRTYNLDGLGNWSTTVYTPEGGSSTTETRTHNKLNEILSFGVLPASTAVLYDHGNNAGGPYPSRGNGNIANDGTRIHAYDALNRLTKVSSTASGTPQIVAYTYDALGRRVLKVVTNGGISGSITNATYRYLFDGRQIVEELLFASGSYSTLRQFVWGRYIDELIQLKIPPTTTTTPPLAAGTYYPLQDLLYRTTATTNSLGSIVEAYDYDAYGNTLIYNGPGTDGFWFTDDDVTTLQPMCEYLFTGRQYDPETEVCWYRSRYYTPALGRFVSKDAVLYQGGVNPYAYTTSQPIILLDPSGTFGLSFGFQAKGTDRGLYTISRHVVLDGIGVGCCSGTLTISYSARSPNLVFARIAASSRMRYAFVEDQNSHCCDDISGPLGWTQQIRESITSIPSSAFSPLTALDAVENAQALEQFETNEHGYNKPFDADAFKGWVDDMEGKDFLPATFEDDPALPTYNPKFPTLQGVGVLKQFRTSLTCGGSIPLGINIDWSFQGYEGQPNRTVIQGTVNVGARPII